MFSVTFGANGKRHTRGPLKMADLDRRYDATRFSRIKRLRHAPHFRPRFQYVENSASTTAIYINIDGESYRKTFLWLVCSVAKVTHRSPHPLQRPNKFAGWGICVDPYPLMMCHTVNCDVANVQCI